MSPLPTRVQSLLSAELDSGEHIVWRAQPLAHRRRRSSLPILLFALPWTAFSIFWVVMASAAGVFALFGVPFVLVGLGMLSSPFLAARNARNSVYAITNRRVLIIAESIGLQGASLKVSSVLPTTIERVQHSDGSGNLIFERTPGYEKNPAVEVGFFDIDDVAAAEKQIRATFSIDR